MFEIIDNYVWEKERKILKYDQHHVDGLQNFAHITRTQADPPLPLHYHNNIIEFHCLLKGRRIVSHAGVLHTVMGGECFFTLPFEPHSSGGFPQYPSEFYNLQIDLRARQGVPPRQVLGLNETLSVYLVERLRNLPYRHLKMSAQDIKMLKNAFEHIAALSTNDVYLAVQFINAFLFDVFNMTPVNELPTVPPDDPFGKVLHYIESHMSENIPLEKLAEISGYSLSAFKQKFKEYTGTTPAEYIMVQKIEYAKSRLHEYPCSVTDLAYELGFSSSNYFSAVFHKYTNYTPTQFRNELQYPSVDEK